MENKKTYIFKKIATYVIIAIISILILLFIRAMTIRSVRKNVELVEKVTSDSSLYNIGKETKKASIKLNKKKDVFLKGFNSEKE